MSLRPRARENRLCELVDGTLVEKAIGFDESRLAIELSYLVKSYLAQNDLGICVGADGMMRIAPGLVRIPDLSFITWDRLPGRESPREAIPDLAPDLAVEVLNEGNTKPEMARKVREYFDAGVALVWLIDPRKRTARVFSAVGKSALVRADQTLDGGAVLPGFVLRLSDLPTAAGGRVGRDRRAPCPRGSPDSASDPEKLIVHQHQLPAGLVRLHDTDAPCGSRRTGKYERDSPRGDPPSLSCAIFSMERLRAGSPGCRRRSCRRTSDTRRLPSAKAG